MRMERTHEEATEAIRAGVKVAILRRHLLEKEPISKLCDEVGLQPTVFYRWQKEFFENGAAAFAQKRPTNHSAGQERIAYLQKKIQTKARCGVAGVSQDWDVERCFFCLCVKRFVSLNL